MKIIKITEKIPAAAALPDGIYQGVYGGYIIEVKHDSRIFELHTQDGVRGMGIRVVVTVKNGEATFEYLNN